MERDQKTCSTHKLGVSKYLLSIDAGTSGVHCLITDIEGRPISLSYREWGYKTLEGLPLGKEFDPNFFWKLICEAIREAMKNSTIDSKDIAGVSATSQREGVIFLDEEGRELYGGPNIDLRALMEGLRMDEKHGLEIYSICGHLPSFLLAPAKLKWFELNRPDIYQRICIVLSIGDWIVYKLSGKVKAEVSLSCELGILDLGSRLPSERIIKLWGLPKNIFPKPLQAGSRVGEVTSKASFETGITTGTPVSLGGADTQCGLLGMGLKDEGDVGILAGWSIPVQMVLDKLILDQKGRIWTGCHVLPGRWVLESNAGEGGNAYRWIAQTLFEKESYAFMENLAQNIPPGSDGVLAFIGPGVMDMSRLGLKLGGFIFPLPLSFSGVGRAHLVRSAIESICFAIKANLSQLEEVSGRRAGKVVLGGGLSENRLLCQILPSILNKPVWVSGKEVSALGAAMCAAVGAGVYSNLEEAMEAMKPPIKIIEPEPLSASEYEEHYQRWRLVLEKMARLEE